MLDTLVEYHLVITIDATHNTTMYRPVKLITVMALDSDRNEAYLVEYCISDNEKENSIRPLFQCIKARAMKERNVEIKT